MPILTHINFLHKTNPNLFWIINLKLSKKIDQPLFGRSAAMRFNKTACRMGPKLHDMAIYFNIPPLNFDFAQENVPKVQIGPIWADWPTPPFVQNGPHCRAPNTRVSIFYKMDPLLILILQKKLLKIFQIGPFWADWQTPYFSKRPAKQIHELAIFFIKWTPWNSDFAQEIVQKNFIAT